MVRMFKMKKEYIFIVAGLMLALGLAIFVSPFASSSPDGLERVAEDKGFIDSSGTAIYTSAPMPDYSVSRVKDEGISTAIAGLIGTSAVFFIGWGVGLLLKKRKNSDAS